jgi:hypothetical protein
VPSLEEVRGKVVLVRRYADMNPMLAPGIDLSFWTDNQNFMVRPIQDILSVNVQDVYNLTLSSKKMEYIETLLPDMASPYTTAGRWYINFTSQGQGWPSEHADQINPWLGTVLNGSKYMRGTFVMDYPSAAIVDRIVRFNF